MNNDRVDLCHLARSVLDDMTDHDRAELMAEMLTELRGPRALELLSAVRASVSLRMQEIIDDRYPLHELAQVYGDPAAVHARLRIGAEREDDFNHPAVIRQFLFQVRCLPEGRL